MSKKYGMEVNDETFWLRSMYLWDGKSVELDEIQSRNIKFDVKDTKGKRTFTVPIGTVHGIVIQVLDALGHMDGCEEFLESSLTVDPYHDWNHKIELTFKYDKPKPKPTNWCIFEKLNSWAICEISHKKLDGKQWCRFSKYIADKKQVVVSTTIQEKVTMGMGKEQRSWASDKKIELTIPVKNVHQVKRQCPICRGSGRVFALRQFFDCGECSGSGRVIVKPKDYYKKVTAEVKS